MNRLQTLQARNNKVIAIRKEASKTGDQLLFWRACSLECVIMKQILNA